MDNLDIYLYIILLVIYAAARLFKASAKRPPVQKGAPQGSAPQPSAGGQGQRKKPFSFEDLLTEFEESFQEKHAAPEVLQPQPSEPVHTPQVSRQTLQAAESPYFTYEGTTYDDISEPAPARTAHDTFIRDSRYKLGVGKRHGIIQRLRRPGGLRDAVLFSEILDRKYF